MGTLGAGSDYASFIHFLGISSMDLAYTYDRVSSLPHHAPPCTVALNLRGGSGIERLWLIHSAAVCLYRHPNKIDFEEDGVFLAHKSRSQSITAGSDSSRSSREHITFTVKGRKQ